MSVSLWLLALVGAFAAFSFLRLLKLYASVLTRKYYWQRLATKKAPDNAFKLVVLGDSIFQGIGASSARKSVVGLISKSINQKLQKPVRIINLSVTGAKVADVRDKQFPKFKRMEVKPDLFIVEVGANNVPGFDSTETFRKDYAALLDLLPKNVIILDIPYFVTEAEKNVIKMNKVVHAEAKKRGMTIAPVHQSIYERRSKRNVGADLFHPNNRGYRAWYAGLWPVVAKRLESKNS